MFGTQIQKEHGRMIKIMDNDLYRLHFDIPLNDNQEQSIDVSKRIVEAIVSTIKQFSDIDMVNVRLGNDGDRGKRNYLNINDSGHAASGKDRYLLKE